MPFGGGFVLSFRRFALGVSLGRYPDQARQSVRIPLLSQFIGKHGLRFLREVHDQKRKALIAKRKRI